MKKRVLKQLIGAMFLIMGSAVFAGGDGSGRPGGSEKHGSENSGGASKVEINRDGGSQVERTRANQGGMGNGGP